MRLQQNRCRFGSPRLKKNSLSIDAFEELRSIAFATQKADKLEHGLLSKAERKNKERRRRETQ